jgi:hypothetical protein
MKLPLFVSASPSASLTSPSVLIGKGKWRLRSNHNSSELELRSKCNTISFPVSDGKEFTVESDVLLVSALFLSCSTDSSVTLYLEKLNAS